MWLSRSDPSLGTVLIERENRLTESNCCLWWRAGEGKINKGKQDIEKGVPDRERGDEDKFVCFIMLCRAGCLSVNHLQAVECGILNSSNS